MRTSRLGTAAVVALVVGSGPLGAQVVESPEAYAGTEMRTLRFDRLVGIQRLSQTVVPVGLVLPMGRFTLDFGTAWVHSRLLRADGSSHPVDAWTDSQVRGSYVFGRDAVVATVLLNIPTGLDKASAKDYSVIGAVSPSLLGFPVASYAAGFSVTPGLAASIPAGDWSFGAAVSVRKSSSFTPYADALGPIVYQPGVEARMRGAIDGLVGASRVAAGFTYSTFGDDHFGKTAAVRGEYRPGPRWIAEVTLIAPVGGSTLTTSFWNFRRTPGDTTGFSALNRENLAAGELALSVPLSGSVVFEPAILGRASKPQTGKGRMLGAGAGLRVRLSDPASLLATARYDTGWLEDGAGNRSDFRGSYISVLFRMSF